ncbi:hypothetical protein RF11_15441 [Thelohanellus kitauei]|uniref:Integrase catalytic domain-containing protein n=1 Tax=Thelohanellus kitauei TaxID=669202 RepID=A0A0C2MJB2_THEKT|nr:hypothetical protein RF11_15441 [Thelohanellus kitauei]
MSNANTHLLTILYQFTRWPEVTSIRYRTADNCTSRLIFHWMSRNSAQLHYCLPPTSNGFVERLRRTLKAALNARLANDKWTDHIPMILQDFRKTQNEDLKVFPAELVFGSQVSLPLGFSTTSPEDVDVTTLFIKLKKFTNPIRPTETSNHDTK